MGIWPAGGARAIERILALSLYSSPAVHKSSSGGTSSAVCVCDVHRDSEAGGNAAIGPRCSGSGGRRMGDGGDLGDADIRAFQCLTNLHIQFCRTAVTISLWTTRTQ